MNLCNILKHHFIGSNKNFHKKFRGYTVAYLDQIASHFLATSSLLQTKLSLKQAKSML